MIALVALAGATIEGGRRGFTDPAVLGGYALALVAGAAFVAIESRRARPMLASNAAIAGVSGADCISTRRGGPTRTAARGAAA